MRVAIFPTTHPAFAHSETAQGGKAESLKRFTASFERAARFVRQHALSVCPHVTLSFSRVHPPIYIIQVPCAAASISSTLRRSPRLHERTVMALTLQSAGKLQGRAEAAESLALSPCSSLRLMSRPRCGGGGGGRRGGRCTEPIDAGRLFAPLDAGG